MAERNNYWYSVISYTANLIRNETLNVGLILIKDDGTVSSFIMDDKSKKLRNFFNSNLERKNYVRVKNMVKYILENIYSNITMGLDIQNSKSLLSQLANNSLLLPNEISISQPHFAQTTDADGLFLKLQDTYIGKSFLEQKSNSINQVKLNVQDIFEKHNLINTKIKKNVNLKPSKLVAMDYRIDFIFATKGNLSLLQSVPNLNDSTLSDWYQKMTTFSSRFDEESNIYILNNLETLSNEQNHESKNQIITLKQMIDDLNSNDNRLKSIDITTNKMTDLTNDISKEGLDLKYLEQIISKKTA
ncbi:DUF3037 domain-containing protein [Leuconostoc gelidum subsp. gasicomitatum]|uniref:DUF3037 domain-containing protein n=1 Tax=Leuconostoc gasicomitatum TaxID=115778 RepID=UPI0007DEFD9E|nr:DUF3037 domain-containing protein [Leuconostoc gasicomitatum]MBZ5947663.1 DUF3037 domain-containing protein [Leuconostoc gasicomitatum]CUW19085.1 hypothetical protein PB1E_0160 [Leuconostoc gasicomitatum]